MSDERDFKEIRETKDGFLSQGIIQGDTIAVSFKGNYLCKKGIAENITYKFRSFYGDKDEDGERLFFHTTEDCTVILIKKVEDELPQESDGQNQRINVDS